MIEFLVLQRFMYSLLMIDYIVRNLTVFVVQVLTEIVSKSHLKEGRIMTILPQPPV